MDVLDPDAIVVGGGLSRVDRLYPMIEKALAGMVFGGGAATPVLKAKHGIRAVHGRQHGYGRQRDISNALCSL